MKNPPFLSRSIESANYHNQNAQIVGTSSYYFNSLLKTNLTIDKSLSRLKWLLYYNSHGKFRLSQAPLTLGLYPINAFFRAKQLLYAHFSVSRHIFYKPFLNHAFAISQASCANSHQTQLQLVQALCSQWKSQLKMNCDRSNHKPNSKPSDLIQIPVEYTPNTAGYTPTTRMQISRTFLLTGLSLLTTPTATVNDLIPVSTQGVSRHGLLRAAERTLRRKSSAKASDFLESLITKALTLELIQKDAGLVDNISHLGYRVVPRDLLKMMTHTHAVSNASRNEKQQKLARSNKTHLLKKPNLETLILQQRYITSVAPTVLICHRANESSDLHLFLPLENRLALAFKTVKWVSNRATPQPKTRVESAQFVKTRLLKGKGNEVKFKSSRVLVGPLALKFKTQLNITSVRSRLSRNEAPTSSSVYPFNKHNSYSPLNSKSSVYSTPRTSKHYFGSMLRKPLVGIQRLQHAIVFELGVANSSELSKKLATVVKSRRALTIAENKPLLKLCNSISIRF